MKDRFERNIDYLRISVTDRCNLRCIYCMPEDGVPMKRHEDMLSYEELTRIVRCAVALGIKKVRLTGGEPLVRKGLPEFVKSLRNIPQIQEIALTTNGLLLGQYAAALKEAGADRVNISLDSLRPDRFKAITRLGDVRAVLDGIEEALRVGLSPVKINTVVMRGVNDDEIFDFVEMAVNRPLHVRFIELMPLGYAGSVFQGAFMSNDEVMTVLRQKISLVPETIKGSGPAVYFKPEGAQGSIGFISALSHRFCHECNRIRLTAEGKIEPCLASSFEVDVGHAIRQGCSDEEIKDLIMRALLAKPAGHQMSEQRYYDKRLMCRIGG